MSKGSLQQSLPLGWLCAVWARSSTRRNTGLSVPMYQLVFMLNIENSRVSQPKGQAQRLRRGTKSQVLQDIEAVIEANRSLSLFLALPDRRVMVA